WKETEAKLIQKKLLIFDLDGTLSKSKTHLQQDMANILSILLWKYDIVVISGCSYEQMLEQFIKPLFLDHIAVNECASRLHLLPMSGTSYYGYSKAEHRFKPVYQDSMSLREKAQILNAFDEALDASLIVLPKPYGDVEEDRGSQVTFSLLGQKAPLNEKEQFDPDARLRHRICDEMFGKLDGFFEIRIGGTTSIDVTHEGMDKAYGIMRLLKIINKSEKDTVFVGDSLFDGGNDASVKKTKIDCMEVDDEKETLKMLTMLAEKMLLNKLENK
ncbi:hypothetical protein LCGC14_1583120, partial [marine sediment metagenome]